MAEDEELFWLRSGTLTVAGSSARRRSTRRPISRGLRGDFMRIRLLMVAVLLGTARAWAGIADSPLPVLSAGETTLHLYSAPGIIAGGGVGTFFACTSTDSTNMQVGVELFGPGGGAPGNDAAATSLTLAPGATVIFGTGSAAGISIDSNLGGFFSKGLARILATSKKLACNGFIADRGNDPPTSIVYLTIIKGTKQKASN